MAEQTASPASSQELVPSADNAALSHDKDVIELIARLTEPTIDCSSIYSLVHQVITLFMNAASGAYNKDQEQQYLRESMYHLLAGLLRQQV